MAGGEVLEVAWGGILPVELSVAVQGAATVRLLDGDVVVDEAAVSGGAALPELVRLRTRRRVERLEIVAGADGAVVSDLALTARPRVDGSPAGGEPPTGEIPLPRSATGA
jgi:hypothetical protein